MRLDTERFKEYNSRGVHCAIKCLLYYEVYDGNKHIVSRIYFFIVFAACTMNLFFSGLCFTPKRLISS